MRPPCVKAFFKATFAGSYRSCSKPLLRVPILCLRHLLGLKATLASSYSIVFFFQSPFKEFLSFFPKPLLGVPFIL